MSKLRAGHQRGSSPHTPSGGRNSPQGPKSQQDVLCEVPPWDWGCPVHSSRAVCHPSWPRPATLRSSGGSRTQSAHKPACAEPRAGRQAGSLRLGGSWWREGSVQHTPGVREEPPAFPRSPALTGRVLGQVSGRRLASVSPPTTWAVTVTTPPAPRALQERHPSSALTAVVTTSLHAPWGPFLPEACALGKA